MADRVQPVFVGGVGRSGTTLCADMMGLHPAFTPIYETGILTGIYRAMSTQRGAVSPLTLRSLQTFFAQWAETLPQRPHNKRGHEQYLHGPHHILFGKEAVLSAGACFLERLKSKVPLATAVDELIFGLFDQQLVLAQKRRWVNKTPGYVNYLPQLLECFPNMKFIHCVRDARDVAASVLSRPWGPKSAEAAAEWWTQQVAAGINFGKEHPENYIEVRYEDLLAMPKVTLEGLFDWLGESVNLESMLEMYQQRVGVLDASRCGAWKSYFDEQDLHCFDKQCAGFLSHYGYLDGSTASASIVSTPTASSTIAPS